MLFGHSSVTGVKFKHFHKQTTVNLLNFTVQYQFCTQKKTVRKGTNI